MTEPITSPSSSKLLRSSIWVAIGALIAAAVVCVVWVLIGDANGMVGKAFLTILLLAAFAGVAILEANLAERRPAWFALASMVSWVLILLLGAFLIWMPESNDYFGGGAERFMKFLLIVLIVQAALLHIRLFSKAHARHETTFTTIVTYVTIALVVILAVMLIVPIMVDEYVEFLPLYWRVVVALAILAAVGTALVPLVNALFAPKKERPAQRAAAAYQGAPAAVQWPTYGDGATPLPVMPDGSPDWNAYYTGRPTYPQGYPAAIAGQPAPFAGGAPGAPADEAVPAAPAITPSEPSPHDEPHQQGQQQGSQPWYQGYPPPPPPPH